MTHFNKVLWMSIFLDLLPDIQLMLISAWKSKNFKFVKGGPNGPKGAPGRKDRRECFAPHESMKSQHEWLPVKYIYISGAIQI